MRRQYENRGINLVCIAKKWSYRTALNLSKLMNLQISSQRKLTKAAIDRIKFIMSKAEDSCVGLRIDIDNKGCSGHSYKIEYAKNKKDGDEEIRIENIKIFVEPSTIMFILGSKMDYVNNKIESGFVFNNPNEKGQCGCGESFHI